MADPLLIGRNGNEVRKQIAVLGMQVGRNINIDELLRGYKLDHLSRSGRIANARWWRISIGGKYFCKI